jgi:hypothetical protein
MDIWTRKKDISGTDKRAGFGFAVGTKGYIGGGFYNGRNFWVYDPNDDTWTQKNDHPVLSYSNSGEEDVGGITFSINDKGYITGTNFYGLWEYDPSTDTWSNKLYVDAVNGQAFAISGKGYIFNTHGELYEYDQGSNQLAEKTPFPGRKMCYPAGFSINERGYIGIGGLFEDNTCTLDVIKDFWEYVP